ncbi:MAG: class I SAM-dependent methyltransferase, partial [Dolichospermum sp.]
MSNQVIHHYNQDHDVSSAREIIPYLLDILKTTPTNVVDVGCGLAQWLRVLKEYGVTEVLGIDGSHVPYDRLNIPIEQFKTIDLRNLSYDFIGKKFDLLLCLEVAEHLEEKYAHQFIKTLTKLSDVILF